MAGLISGLRPDKLISVWAEIEDFYDEWGRYMCCWTHEYRDMLAQDLYEPVELVAYSSAERCQCKFGNPCLRRIQNEALQCDWCWAQKENGHQRYCDMVTRETAYRMPGRSARFASGNA